jgi:hypothetical protein
MSWFRKKAKPLTVKEQAAQRCLEIEREYLGLNIVSTPEDTGPSEMERYFAMKNDILRFNMSKSADVPTEGNEFD